MQITLKAARINAGLTQQQVSQATGIDRGTLKRWERGDTFPKAAKLAKLCELYGLPVRSVKVSVDLNTLLISADIQQEDPARSSACILRGLISYHERMTIGNYPERDFYLNALRFALSCVEEKISE